MKVLLVDDDRDLVELLAFALRRAGITPLLAPDARTARRLFETEQPDLVVLDVLLGPDNGLDVLAEIRQRSRVPVILLSALDAEDDKVRGLELGADDYLTKPFSHRELIARIQAHRRRSQQEWEPPRKEAAVLRVGPVTLNLAEHRVLRDGQPVSLTVTEFRVLHYLMLNAGTPVPTRSLLKGVWGYDDPSGGDVVRVTLHRLRRKLEPDPSRPGLLRTVPGVGVVLGRESDAEEQSA